MGPLLCICSSRRPVIACTLSGQPLTWLRTLCTSFFCKPEAQDRSFCSVGCSSSGLLQASQPDLLLLRTVAGPVPPP